MTLRKIIAENIVVQRLLRKWTQTDLADKIGIHACNLSAIENARVGIRIDTLDEIAQALKVSPSLLVTPNQVPTEARGKRIYIKRGLKVITDTEPVPIQTPVLTGLPSGITWETT